MDPYREGKPLHAVIPPDRRRLKAFLLLVGGMIAGASLFAVGSREIRYHEGSSCSRGAHSPLVYEPSQPSPPAPPTLTGRLHRIELNGPDGPITLPPGQLAVVHVWLQGCSDCMPAFEAMKRISTAGGLGLSVPEFNVAYGTADPTWAAKYGVRKNLVFDRGGAAVVRPLGISSFTTLVVAGDGTVIHSDRPDRPGYAERLREITSPTPPHE